MAAGGCPGVFVAFNRKVMLGCRASKVRTMSFDAFESINYPYIGEISSLGLHICRENLVEKRGIFRPQTSYSDKVFLLKLYREQILRSWTIFRKRLTGAFTCGRLLDLAECRF